MPPRGVILKGEGFAGIADEQRRAIYEAEKSAAAMGILPDDPEKRKAIIDRMKRRLANVGWGFNREETVVRVDDFGRARIIPKSQATGWMKGLPAHPDSHDVTSRSAQVGRTRPYTERIAFPDPGPILPVDPRVAAERFHSRIVAEMERTGYIPGELRQELLAQGWKLGQPVPRDKLDAWCARFQEQYHREHGRK